MAPTPIVSAEQASAVVDSYLDRMADLARRLGVPAAAVGEVTRRAGVAMVDACAREPETVGDVLGHWAANIRTLATRSGTGTTAVPAAAPSARSRTSKNADTGDLAAVSTGREARAATAVLDKMDERGRLALLMRDSYDSPPGAAAVALGVTVAESETIVGEARLRLMSGINGRPAPTLAGHGVIAGVSIGTLGALADGSAQDSDPAVRLRRRHVGGCQACAAILDAQNRARVVLAGLPVFALPDAMRASTLDAILTRASTGLLADVEVEASVVRAARVLPAAVVGVALALALILGVGVGAILRHAKASVGQNPTPTASGVILSSPSATAKPTKTAGATASASVSATPSFLQSYVPTAAPTSAKPSPSKTLAKKSPAPKVSHTPAKKATTAAAVVTTGPPSATPSEISVPSAPASAPASPSPATTSPGGIPTG